MERSVDAAFDKRVLGYDFYANHDCWSQKSLRSYNAQLVCDFGVLRRCCAEQDRMRERAKVRLAKMLALREATQGKNRDQRRWVSARKT